MTKPVRTPDDGDGGGDQPWPLLRSLTGYQASFLSRDLVAGLTLAAVAIPEQMATARLGGFPPGLGFIAFAAGSLAFAVFGSSRQLSCGADSTIVPIFAGSLVLLTGADPAEYPTLATALALMVGAALVAGGIFRLGWIADLLSIPVTLGFLAGIAAHILISQLPGVLGLPAPQGPLLVQAASIAGHLPDVRPAALWIGLGVLTVTALSDWFDVRVPGALLGLVGATVAVALFGLQSRGVAVLGPVAGLLPMPAQPELSVDHWLRLIPLGLLIAAVVMVQTAATTRSFPSATNQPSDIDRDFIGVGAGSILAGLIGAFPVNASPPRTAIAVQSGGRSQLAGILAAAVVLVLAVVGARFLQEVPQAALGGVLLFIALRIVRIGEMAAIYRQSFAEFLLIVATAGAIILLPIERGVGIGIALSLLHGIWSTTRAGVIPFCRVPGTSIWWPSSAAVQGELEPHILVLAFPAPLSFLNAYRFRQGVLRAWHGAASKPRLIVLEATGITEIDYTGAKVLGELIRQCQAEGVAFAIARLESVRGQDALTRFGVARLLGPGHVYRSVEEAIVAFRGEPTTGVGGPELSGPA